MPDVVFIGLAHWHVGMHLRAAQRAGLTVRGGWDPDAGLAAAWADRTGNRAFGSAAAALDSGAGLAIVTGTPLEMPARLAQAIESGLSAVVEKPVTRTADGLEALATLATGRNAFVAVALPHRAGPLAGADVSGQRHLSFRLVNGPPGRYRDWGSPWVLDPSVSGGGALRNLGIHGIDLALHLLGPDLEVADAAVRHWEGEAVEDHALVRLAAPDGRTAVIEAGYLHPAESGSDFEARLVSADAILVDDGDRLHRAGADGRSTTHPAVLHAERYDALMVEVVRRLRAKEPPPAGLDDLLRAMRVIDAAYAKAGGA